MFNLRKIINNYNLLYNAKINLNKTWGLVYLQPKRLYFLNNCFPLIRNSIHYTSLFIPDLERLTTSLNKRKQSFSNVLVTLQDIIQLLITDQSIFQRLNWEKYLSECLNKNDFWQERFNQLEAHSRIQSYLIQLQAQWKTHQPFQYHSSKDLLLLLDIVIQYHYHYLQAHKELKKNQAIRLALFRIPNAIAKKYTQFLNSQLKNLQILRGQILEALLLRLNLAEQQNQVTYDDVSYFLAQEVKRLCLPSIGALPKYPKALEASAFNEVHRAIEKNGNAKQIKRLYQLAWYVYATFNSEDICVITVSQQRLLLPNALLNFWPKKYINCMGLLKHNTRHTRHLEFLQIHQALLAQLVLSLNFSSIPIELLSLAHPTLRSLTTRYQLIQQSLQSVNQSPIRWWQWQEKHWKKAWQKWLLKKLRENQAKLSDCLTKFCQQLQSRSDLLCQATYREKVQHITRVIQKLIDNDCFEHRYTLLTITLKRLSTLF